MNLSYFAMQFSIIKSASFKGSLKSVPPPVNLILEDNCIDGSYSVKSNLASSSYPIHVTLELSF